MQSNLRKAHPLNQPVPPFRQASSRRHGILRSALRPPTAVKRHTITIHCTLLPPTVIRYALGSLPIAHLAAVSCISRKLFPPGGGTRDRLESFERGLPLAVSIEDRLLLELPPPSLLSRLENAEVPPGATPLWPVTCCEEDPPLDEGC
jgi:hypothetical protein